MSISVFSQTLIASLWGMGIKAQAYHTEIVYKLTIYCCCCFANKSKTSTWKKLQQKHWFVYKLYGFCCCAYQNKQRKNRHFFLLCLGLGGDGERATSDLKTIIDQLLLQQFLNLSTYQYSNNIYSIFIQQIKTLIFN
jgi:hypothetical protein